MVKNYTNYYGEEMPDKSITIHEQFKEYSYIYDKNGIPIKAIVRTELIAKKQIGFKVEKHEYKNN